MKMKIKIVFVFLLIFGALSAQERPVVGVVLSGGGAKGFAHVGMLKVLDSLGIPVDYVAGTSMGSVVGSLYALGYNPNQIEKIVTDIDWTSLMSDAPEREYLTHLNKTNFEKYLFKTNLQGLGIVPPSGFISGQKMIAKLNEVTQNYHGERDFMTDFPRKFLCVATDLRTGEETVFTHGSLPDAIRASVSIPSMFTPYRVDGELKVDGGMVNNFPSDHLKELGCDIIIGLSVQSSVQDSLGQISIIEVLEMMGMFIDTKSNDYRQSLCDIVIHPDMQGYGLTDFESNEIIVEITEAQNTRIDDKVANKEIQYVKNQGVSVALDDYGVKGSNLERLINTPWNIIKLDKQLIDNVVTNKRSRVAVEGIKTMATRLNNQIIAEGVETKEQLKYLKKIGIDLIQGFLFSKPMPGNQIEGYIKQFSIKNNYS